MHLRKVSCWHFFPSIYFSYQFFRTPPCARHSIEVDRFPLQVRSDFHPSKSEKEWESVEDWVSLEPLCSMHFPPSLAAPPTPLPPPPPSLRPPTPAILSYPPAAHTLTSCMVALLIGRLAAWCDAAMVFCYSSAVLLLMTRMTRMTTAATTIFSYALSISRLCLVSPLHPYTP